jgi:hypothetical protein
VTHALATARLLLAASVAAAGATGSPSRGIRVVLEESPRAHWTEVRVIAEDGARTFPEKAEAALVFDDLAPGRYWVEIDVSGRKRQVHVIDVEPGDRVQDLVTHLEPGAPRKTAALQTLSEGGRVTYIASEGDDSLAEVTVDFLAVDASTGERIPAVELVLSDGQRTFFRGRVDLPFAPRLLLPSPLLVEAHAVGFAPAARRHELPTEEGRGTCTIPLQPERASTVRLDVHGDAVAFSSLGCAYRPELGVTLWPATRASESAFKLGVDAGRFVVVTNGYATDESYWCALPAVVADAAAEVRVGLWRATTLVLSPSAKAGDAPLPVDVYDARGTIVARFEGYGDVPRRAFLPPGAYSVATRARPDERTFVVVPPSGLTLAVD